MRVASRSFASLLVAAALLGGCGPKRIPGTDIKDSPETRAVVDVIEQYRLAVERRDPNAVLALVSRRYFDNAGTTDPADDVDYDQLRSRLVEDYSKLVAVNLEIAVKRIDVEGDRASAFVFYDERYRIKMRSGEVAKQASDVHRMQLVLENGAWRFASGI
jgi:hypothetical protein